MLENKSGRTHKFSQGVPIDINHGINDGRNNADGVSVSQSLRALHLVTAIHGLTEEQFEYFTREKIVPPTLEIETAECSYGVRKVLFRRQSGNTRLTVFGGASTEAAFSG